MKRFTALGQALGFYRTSRDNKRFHVNNNKWIQIHLLGDSFPPTHSKKLQLNYCIAYITYTVCFSSSHLYGRHLLFKPDLNLSPAHSQLCCRCPPPSLSQYSDENMMDAGNLAIVFGPTLLPTPETLDQVACQAHVNEVIKTVILNHDNIFPDTKELPGPVYEKCMTGDQYW